MHELKKVEGPNGEEVFLDRDGKTFETLINYLRNDRKVFPEFVEKNSVIAGNPAKVVRSDIKWVRNRSKLNASSPEKKSLEKQNEKYI